MSPRLDSKNSNDLSVEKQSVNWEDEGATSLSYSYYDLEEAARRLSWITERFDIGLLIISPSK